MSLERLDLRIEGLHLKGQLLVTNDRDRLAGSNRIPFPDIELDHNSADTSARGHHADTLHRCKHGLFVCDGVLCHGERFRSGETGLQGGGRKNRQQS
ncbi:hypothetical protein ABIF41_004336 [Bradyrhizobium japonicum]